MNKLYKGKYVFILKDQLNQKVKLKDYAVGTPFPVGRIVHVRETHKIKEPNTGNYCGTFDNDSFAEARFLDIETVFTYDVHIWSPLSRSFLEVVYNVPECDLSDCNDSLAGTLFL